MGVTPGAWEEYMAQWNAFLIEGEPYPPHQFLNPELYVWGGGGGAGGYEYPQDAGLVMVWGSGGPPEGSYSSAWKFDYQMDPDLSNVIIRVTVTAPQFDAFGNQVNVVSFGIQDIAGAVRAWHWNVGPGQPIAWNTRTTIEIHTWLTGTGATSPAASAYMNNPAFNIAASQVFIVDENCQWVGGPTPVPPPGQAIPGMWNYWHNLIVVPNGQIDKWHQPPKPANPANLYFGWNEASFFEGPQIVADDWFCNTNDPITAVRWWGSYLGWDESEPPQVTPIAFHLAVWTDVPAGVDTPFSHPGMVIWEIYCDNFASEFVGWDFNPIIQEYEACYFFEQQLDPEEFFYQDPGNAIYWLSISAVYQDGTQVEHMWGCKTRPRDPASPAPDDAVVIWAPTNPHVGDTYLAGSPLWFPEPEDSWDAAFELIATPQGPGVKWEQPPLFNPDSQHPECFWGWDEFSYYGDNPPMQIVADDWVCTDDTPVTDIHWWGSYPGWMEPMPPPGAPDMFHIGIWTDVPANPPEQPFSHPGVLIWQFFVPRTALNEVPVGCDFYPGYPPDTCFAYTLFLPPDAWFFQEEPNTIYWLSIEAFNSQGPPQFPWGWKTRLRDPVSPAPDDAVRIFNPTMPGIGSQFMAGMPIEDPPGTSWDTSFILTTSGAGEPYVKWSQPPAPYDPPDAIEGWDEFSVRSAPQIVADDWVCVSDQPVKEIIWWGSFIGWGHREPPPETPNTFHIAIWTDVPADDNNPFSHPGEVIWETYCGNFTAEFFGWDFDPRNPNMPPEACFRFTQELPQPLWFVQGPDEGIYWISIAAVYQDPPVEFPWGWKTRSRDLDSPAPDDAVRIFDPTAPDLGDAYVDGQPIFWPDEEHSWDMAFRLRTPAPPQNPKWQQLPYGFQGFDAASDYWWQEGGEVFKWTQGPDPQWPGLHAHDAIVVGQYQGIVLADQWMCQGGDVNDLHWYGNYELDAAGQEIRGAGINNFQLSLHANMPGSPWCLPGQPLWAAEVLFAEVAETFTGLYNNEGCPIYRYTYLLPFSFEQVAGEIYWLDLMAVSVDPNVPALWRWQEAGRLPNPIICPAAQMTFPPPSPWTSIVWPGDPVTYSDLAFEVTSQVEGPDVNKVVTDDFISDGRPIEQARWWGSYFDERYRPDFPPMEPFVLDGWFLSFHHTQSDATCPPGDDATDTPTVLAVYFAPAQAVLSLPTDLFDCFGHQVFEHWVDLSQCCLLCVEADPRDGSVPAGPDAFAEVAGQTYWLGIQAVVGVTWNPPSCGYEGRILTGHVPSDLTEAGHFWGWHTSPGPPSPCSPMEEACVGEISDRSTYPPDCWEYDDWVKQPQLCPNPPDPPDVHMAFELGTPVPGCGLLGDMNEDGLIDGDDVQGFVDCLLGDVMPAGNCLCADFNCSGTPDAGDVEGFVQALLD